jgi:hypothetical protein
VQVSAAEVFGLQTVLPWEFNATSPTRSVAAPALTSGLPFLGARLLGTALYKVRHLNPRAKRCSLLHETAAILQHLHGDRSSAISLSPCAQPM